MDNASRVIARLKERGLTLATAESLTGGMLGQLLTGVSGSSAVYRGGVISYCNEVKHQILAVSQHISLSPEDIKNSLKAFPLYLAILLILTAVCGLIGAAAMDAVMGGLSVFSAYLTALFVIVLVSALIQLLVALPVWCLRMLFGRG